MLPMPNWVLELAIGNIFTLATINKENTMREVLCGLVIGLCVGVPVGAWFCAWCNANDEED